MRFSVGSRGMFVSKLAMLMSRSCVVLGFVVLAECVVMLGLMIGAANAALLSRYSAELTLLLTEQQHPGPASLRAKMALSTHNMEINHAASGYETRRTGIACPPEISRAVNRRCRDGAAMTRRRHASPDQLIFPFRLIGFTLPTE
jgi:hypothetical protein